MKNKVYYCTEKKSFCEKEEELPDALRPDDVLVKYLYCGICGGDYSTYIGRRAIYPVSLGHEFVAEVIRIGENVENICIGQNVISDFNYRCGECIFCKQNKSHLCVKNNIQDFSNRAFAKYGIINKKYLYAIHMTSNLNRACLIEPLSCVLHAIDVFQPTFNKPILINGLGSIGTMMVFYLKRILHCENVYVYDRHSVRLNNILQCFQVKTMEQLSSAAAYIVECTNEIDGVKHMLHIAPQGASLCIMSHLYGEDTSFIYEEICRKELLTCYPLRNGHTTNIYRAIDYVEKYWTSEMDMLCSIDKDLNRIFQNKACHCTNKQIWECN